MTEAVPSWLRPLIVLVAALLLTVQIVRDAAVRKFATQEPVLAAKFWAHHPAVEISLGLARIGAAARQHQPVSAQTFEMIRDAAVKSPLSSEPFTVKGVEASTKGDLASAQTAFVAAQRRDPRSASAAYFLAESYLRAGNGLKGLEQLALLARLTPDGGRPLLPFIAGYAQDPSNWPELRALFRSQDSLEESVLGVLAQDPRNSDAILAIADANHRKPDSPWLTTLLGSLVASGDYARAHSLWSSIGRGGGGRQLLYDPDFSSPGPPPPFNWSLTTANVGIAERQAGKRLHVVFYANQDGVLASQLLLLEPGSYRLHMQLAGQPVHPEEMLWSVRCANATEPLATASIGDAAARGLTFQVTANCVAKMLELSGRSGDIAQQSDVTITGLGLDRVGSNR